MFWNFDKSNDNLKHLQAQKLVSLFGWEPRALPYVVDCKDRSTQLVKDSDVKDSYHMVINCQNPSIRFHYVASEQSVEANEESGSCSGRHADPNAVVLDCKLCGASVGLRTFSMVPQPLELFRLVGYTEVIVTVIQDKFQLTKIMRAAGESLETLPQMVLCLPCIDHQI